MFYANEVTSGRSYLVSRWGLAFPEKPTEGIEGWGFEPGAISPNSIGEKEDMLETEFNYVADDLFNHAYV